MTAPRHILVTGANGFIGSRLVEHVLADARFADCRLTLCDVQLNAPSTDPRVRLVVGDLGDRAVRQTAIDGRADIVFHLAGILGGAAEADPALSRRVNLDAALDLLDDLRDEERPPRIVFASSAAVFGSPLPDRVDDDTWPVPTMTYGSHKRMVEIAIEHMTARKWIDGLAIRLPGIVARKNADARLRSAFLNTMFHDYAAGRAICLPVAPDSTTWLISVPACIDALVHAATVDAAVLSARRAFSLPAQTVRIDELLEALSRRFPGSASAITFAPAPDIVAQFGSLPTLSTGLADRAGFTHDGTIDRLVVRALDLEQHQVAQEEFSA